MDPGPAFKDILNAQKLNQLEQFAKALITWNKHVNLISRKDESFIWQHHIWHALSIGYFQTFKPGETLLDIGTGGGFPGLPLAIALPECNFILMDSIEKKIHVVNALIKELNITNDIGVRSRFEESRHAADWIVSRAVTQFPKFMTWVKSYHFNAKALNTKQGGILYLKGGDLKTEMEQWFSRSTQYSLSDVFTDTYYAEKKLIKLGLDGIQFKPHAVPSTVLPKHNPLNPNPK